jgi:hypothetical protein
VKAGELVIYVDESGSPDVISTSGEDLLALGRTANHLVIVAVRCPDPNVVARCIRDCIAWADPLAGRKRPRGALTALHAREDEDQVRERVYRDLADLPIKATAIVIDKRRLETDGWRTDRSAFYNDLAARLLSDSLHLHERTRIVFSRKNFETEADLRKLVDVVGEKWTEYVLRANPELPSLVTARQERARANVGLQVADYVAWALFRAFEARDLRWYEMIRPIVRHVFDIGTGTHYTPRRPIQNPS